MSGRDSPPRRLLEMDGPAADCLRDSLAARELSVPRFVVLREKRLLRSRVNRAVLLAGFSALALAVVPRLRGDAPRTRISAEPTTTRPSSPPLTAPEATAADRARFGAALSAPEPPARPPMAKPRRLSAAAPLAPEVSSADTQPKALPRTSQPKASALSAKACADLARRGAAVDALDCYSELARGPGMSAELALFEKARLEGKVLRRPALALATLETYRARFPQGSLRAEVMLAQVEWAVAIGDELRAKTLVDEALSSGLLRERGPELERLRESLVKPR